MKREIKITGITLARLAIQPEFLSENAHFQWFQCFIFPVQISHVWDQIIWMMQSITEETCLTLPGHEQLHRYIWSSVFSKVCTSRDLPLLHTLGLLGPRQRVSGVLQRSELWRGKFNFPDGSSGHKRRQYSSGWLINAKVAKVYLTKEIRNTQGTLREC